MSFIKHGDYQPITHIIEAPEIIDEAAKESLEKVKKATLEEKRHSNLQKEDIKE